MRHAPFRIGIAERDAWLTHMRRAVDSLDLDPADNATLWTYLERAALFMVNVETPDVGGGVRQLPHS
jgi:hemoglobin